MWGRGGLGGGGEKERDGVGNGEGGGETRWVSGVRAEWGLEWVEVGGRGWGVRMREMEKRGWLRNGGWVVNRSRFRIFWGDEREAVEWGGNVLEGDRGGCEGEVGNEVQGEEGGTMWGGRDEASWGGEGWGLRVDGGWGGVGDNRVGLFRAGLRRGRGCVGCGSRMWEVIRRESGGGVRGELRGVLGAGIVGGGRRDVGLLDGATVDSVWGVRWEYEDGRHERARALGMRRARGGVLRGRSCSAGVSALTWGKGGLGAWETFR
ncbi:hypothetical protein Tco_1569389 [Tanacetum coccineum]